MNNTNSTKHLNIGIIDLIQCVRYTAGLAICGLVIYYLTKIDLGLAPWEVLSKGISLHVPLTFGQVIIVISAVVLILDIIMKEKIGIGMILDVFLVGVFVDLFTMLDPLPEISSFPVKIVVYCVSIFVMGFAQFLCMSAGQGMGPRAALLVGIGKRMRKVPIGGVQMMLLCTVLAIGWMLGGPVGVGTLIMMIGLGPALQVWSAVFHTELRDVEHKGLLDYVVSDQDV